MRNTLKTGDDMEDVARYYFGRSRYFRGENLQLGFDSVYRDWTKELIVIWKTPHQRFPVPFEGEKIVAIYKIKERK